MKLDEAIETLTQHQKGTDPLYLPQLPDAEKLGLEALKRVEWHKEQHESGYYELLPGETKD